MPSVFIAMPINRNMHPLVLDSLFRGSGVHVAHFHLEPGNSLQIDAKRNKCVEVFLEETDCSHILFWDSDTVAIPDAVNKLLEANKPVIAATVYRKGGYHTPVFGDYDEKRNLFKTPVLFKYNQIRKCDIVGTGFVLIKREVFEKLKRPWFKCADNSNSREDVYFSRLCMKAKIPIYVDTGLHLGHLADNYVITNENYEMNRYWHLIKMLRDQGKLDEFRKVLLDQLKIKTPEMADRQTPVDAFALAKQSDKFHFKLPEAIGKAYIEYINTISTKVWAISWELSSYIVKTLHALRPKRILDLGSGFSSYLLRWYCHDVTSVETDPKWLNKTKEFLERHKLRTDDLMLLDDFKFDGIYDLCLLDIGLAEKDRPAFFNKVKEHCKVIILDDMHMQPYRLAAKEAFKNDLVFDLGRETRDTFGRYAWMVIGR